ncbi:MAG TPA: DUF2267 domain-containing protein [Actinobacteria bacterium]|nr:DUF2267 domain-containing protein [Actinomycetota bacterium]
MSDFFAPTVQKSHEWVNEVAEELGTEDRHRAYLAMKASLLALRDRLPTPEMAQLAAQLPMLIRGVFYEGWNPTHTPVKDRHLDDFLGHIADRFPGDLGLDEARRFAEATYAVLARHVTPGELDDVVGVLPHEIRVLFPGS